MVDARKEKDRRLKSKYGIGVEHYDALFATQGGVCAICQQPETAIDPRSREVVCLAVDHMYGVGTIRGLLCQTCNRALGYLKDSAALLRKAADYIDHHNGVTHGEASRGVPTRE